MVSTEAEAADRFAVAFGIAAAVYRVVAVCRIAVLDEVGADNMAVVIADVDSCYFSFLARILSRVATCPNLVELLAVWSCFQEQFANPSGAPFRLD